MTVDNTKLSYSSNWDIDQLVAIDSVSIASGLTSIYTITSGATVPTFEVQFKPSGSSVWYHVGRSSTDGTLANLFSFYTYVSSGQLYINTTSNGTARYFVWADKVDN